MTDRSNFIVDLKELLTYVDDHKRKLEEFRKKYLKAWFQGASAQKDAELYIKSPPIFSVAGSNVVYVLKDIVSVKPGDIKLIVSYGRDAKIKSQNYTKTIILTIPDANSVITAAASLEINSDYLNVDTAADPDMKIGNNAHAFSLPSDGDLSSTAVQSRYMDPYGAYYIYGTLAEITFTYVVLAPIFKTNNILPSQNVYLPLIALPKIYSVTMATMINTAEVNAITNPIGNDKNSPVATTTDLKLSEINTPYTMTKITGSTPTGTGSTPTPASTPTSAGTTPASAVTSTSPKKDAFTRRDILKTKIENLERRQESLFSDLKKVNKIIQTLEVEAQQLACARETINPKNKGGIDNASEKIKDKRNEIIDKENDRAKIKQAIDDNKIEITKARGEMIALLPHLI